MRRFGLRSALVLSLAGALVSPALAGKGQVAGTEMQGYGRAVFMFDEPVSAKARLAGTILIVEFDAPVTVDIEKLATQLPNYVTVARLDPNGRSLRLGLAQSIRPDVKLAGERVYLDLLPPRWVGLPPSLPPEVVADLVARAKKAEEQLRKLDREQGQQRVRDLDLRVGQTTLFKRAIFAMPRPAQVEFDEQGQRLTLTFAANFQIAEDLIQSRLAGLVRDVVVEKGAEHLSVAFSLHDGITARGFREDDSFALDFSRADGLPIESATAPAASPAPNKPAAAKAEAPKTDMPRAEAPKAEIARSGGVDVKPAVQPDPTAKPTLKIAQQDMAADAARLIDVTLQGGRDPQGFALRVAGLDEKPIAVLPRGNALLVVIETDQQPSLPTIPADLKHTIEGVSVDRTATGTVLRITPKKEGAFWLQRDGGDLVIQRGRAAIAQDALAGAPVRLKRSFDSVGKEALDAAVGPVGKLVMLDDPFSGQRIAVVPAPRASFANAKTQSFPEFTIERTLAGFAVLPLDEAVTIRREPDSLLIGHEIRLNLSNLPKPADPAQASKARALLLDPALWATDAQTPFRAEEAKLFRNAAETPRASRSEARYRLARFYLANRRFPEANGVLDVLRADDAAFAQRKDVIFHRALSAVMLGHTIDATKLLAEPAIAMEDEQKLLQALLDAANLRHPQAVAGFRQVEEALRRYPEDLQAQFRRVAVESGIETGDPIFARAQLMGYEQVDSRFRDPHLQQLMAARLAEIQGQFEQAFMAYSQATKSADRRIEAEARYGRATAGLADAKLSPEEAKAEFETLTAIWRRSEVEIKSLARLAEIYVGEGRWREAFLASARATALMPNHPVSRRLEEAMGRRFEALFLDNEAEKLSKIEALALQNEFRSLIPPGRRGDEIARRLADRLFDLDLVGEATDILDHQVRKRLDGVARASVATRLAVMYLSNRQPAEALASLHASRLSTIPKDLLRARTLLEARALGELFRTGLAIEILSNESGDDVDRLRADIHWKGKNWREAGEGYERILGESWQGEEPLSESQRSEAMRAALAYVLADEKLSLDRLRSKFLAKMAQTPDAVAFNVITIESLSQPEAFRSVARNVVNADTMTDFLAAYRKRYPETGGPLRPVRSAGDQRQSSAQGPGNRG